MAVLLLAVVVWVGMRAHQPAAAPAPVAVEELTPWMLQSGHGIGPATVEHWLQVVRQQGPQALAEPARSQLQPLIADPGQRSQP